MALQDVVVAVAEEMTETAALHRDVGSQDDRELAAQVAQWARDLKLSVLAARGDETPKAPPPLLEAPLTQRAVAVEQARDEFRGKTRTIQDEERMSRWPQVEIVGGRAGTRQGFGHVPLHRLDPEIEDGAEITLEGERYVVRRFGPIRRLIVNQGGGVMTLTDAGGWVRA